MLPNSLTAVVELATLRNVPLIAINDYRSVSPLQQATQIQGVFYDRIYSYFKGERYSNVFSTFT